MSNGNTVITVIILGHELVFHPTETAYNQFLNEAARKPNVMGVLREYIQKIIAPESREDLKEIIRRPGVAGKLVELVNDEYAPDIEAFIKR